MANLKDEENIMNEELSKLRSKGLKLHPEDEEKKPFTEPTYGRRSFSDVANDEEYSAGAVDESMLSEEDKKKVEEFYNQIDVSDIRMVNSYGSEAQKGIANFSSSITSRVKTKEFGDVGESLRNLRMAISSTTEPPKKGIFGFFQKGKAKVKYMVSNYESAETNIQKIQKDLERHQQTLTKDIFVFDQMYDMNLEFYKDLTMYIIAGKKALNKARSTKLVELRDRASETQDQLDVQNYRDYEDACKRFEKRIFDLETTRVLSIQTAPQIRLLQNSDQEVVDKLRSDILNTIPLWRNQMVLALGIEHSRRALDAQSSVTEMTNEMFRRNAETLKQGAIDAAVASERSIIDIEAMKEANANIIASINEVVKIHEDGTKKRAEAEEQLKDIENELKEALLEAGKKY